MVRWKETSWWIGRISLYYLYIFTVNLKLFQNKELILKYVLNNDGSVHEELRKSLFFNFAILPFLSISPYGFSFEGNKCVVFDNAWKHLSPESVYG